MYLFSEMRPIHVLKNRWLMLDRCFGSQGIINRVIYSIDLDKVAAGCCFRTKKVIVVAGQTWDNKDLTDIIWHPDGQGCSVFSLAHRRETISYRFPKLNSLVQEKLNYQVTKYMKTRKRSFEGKPVTRKTLSSVN